MWKWLGRSLKWKPILCKSTINKDHIEAAKKSKTWRKYVTRGSVKPECMRHQRLGSAIVQDRIVKSAQLLQLRHVWVAVRMYKGEN